MNPLRSCRAALLCAAVLAAVIGPPSRAADDGPSALDPFSVKADRIEEFGFSARDFYPARRTPIGNVVIGIIDTVVPNTAAAKAGLQPGERILKVDGRAVTVSLFQERSKWGELIWKKNVEARAGKEVKWTLEIQSADRKQTRSVVLVLPTPAPHWGASTWQPPADRVPASVRETGPLAERAREVLNSGVWAMFDGTVARNLGFSLERNEALLGFYWEFQVPPDERSRMLHRMFVTQQRGRTEIILTLRSATDRGIPEKWFLTSPSGELDRTWGLWDERRTEGKMRAEEIPADQAAVEFQREVDFWLRQVGKVSPRWPLELIPAGTTAKP